MRSRRRLTYAALAGVIALGGTGLTVGVATAQLGDDDPDLTMVEEAAVTKDSLLATADDTDSGASADPGAPADSADSTDSADSDEVSVADEGDDAEETTETDADAGTDSDADADSGTGVDSGSDDAEVSDETDDAEETGASEKAGQTIAEVESDEVEDTATTQTADDPTRCPFTVTYKGSVRQMLIKREGGVRTKAYDAGERTRSGKSRNIVTIGIGFNMSRGDARTIINRILSETSPQSKQADIKSGKAFDDLKAGVTELTDEQVTMLFEVTYEEAKDMVTRRGIESFDKLPRAVQAALIDVAYMRPGNINDIADEVNAATQAALAEKQPLTEADYEAAAKRLETFGAIAAKRGQGGNKIRFSEDAAMLRNKC
ncbi:hypothetical protein ACFFR3_42020 [Nonomuraea salmonea]|uniref:Uncharacterized protein n=2 Tax=Nonomuraea salmonea TaxID=46181 RepID=A0ABV5P0T2_9ACTN